MTAMKVVMLPRQGGKTTQMLQLAQETFSYIVCPTMADVERLWALAREMELNIPQPISWVEFTSGRYRPAGIKGFLIDDVDRCLQGMTRVDIKAITLTGGEG